MGGKKKGKGIKGGGLGGGVGGPPLLLSDGECMLAKVAAHQQPLIMQCLSEMVVHFNEQNLTFLKNMGAHLRETKKKQ